MDLSLIFTVPGKPGLYKLVSQGKNSAIVESLSDKKRIPVFTMDRISSLAEIAIYTDGSEVSLANVFRNIYQKENGAKCMDHNSAPEAIRAYFSGILPDYDEERVYVSNIKKVLQWYNILKDSDLVDMELSEREKAQIEGLAEHEAEEAAVQQEKPATEPKPEKSVAAKKPKVATGPKTPKTVTTGKSTAAKPAVRRSTAQKGK